MHSVVHAQISGSKSNALNWNGGDFKCKKKGQNENGSSSLLPISPFAFKTEWFAIADLIS
jgi:hypothetical protein